MKLRDYQSPEPIWEFFRKRKGDGIIHNPLVVMPTGAGKSIVIAAIIKDMLDRFGGRRVLMLTHQKELIAQNYEKLLAIYPECEPGIYSASLGRKQTDNKVLCCGIQSVHNKAHQLGDFSLILIDECHTLPKSGFGMYRKFIAEINQICGKVPVIGLTATPYRLDSGYLHKGDGALFTDIAYEVHINELLDSGYLCPLTTKQTGFIIDASMVKKRGGEFITEALEAVVDPVTEDALLDAIPRIGARKSGIIFCVTVKHAQHVSDFLNSKGILCAVVTGETPKAERDRILQQYKAGEIRCLANVNVLTTGFDAPSTDFLIMLRPTQSPGLYCLDNETEILTAHGWKNHENISVGDCVPSLCLKTGKGVWTNVTNKIEREVYLDELFVEYDAPRANFRVTNNHNMLFQTSTFNGGWSEIKIETAEKMASIKDSIRMPTAVTIDQAGVPLSKWELYFIGIMMTDGTWTTHTASISQSERYPEILLRIEDCLNKCGLRWRKFKVKVNEENAKNMNIKQVHDRWIYTINAGDPKNGEKGKGFRYLMPFLDKDLSPALMQINKQQFIWLFDGLFDGDGIKLKKADYIPKSKSICSARKLAVDRLQALAVIHGFTGHLRKEEKGRLKPIWFLTLTDKDWRSVGGCGNRPKINVTQKKSSNESVWCVETETGTIITRRKGKVTVMGNCQMAGRGMRLADDKYDCLVLDYAGNIQRHGPIDAIQIRDKRKKSDDEPGESPVKTCPECESIVHAAVRECACGYIFPPPALKIDNKASNSAILSKDYEPEWKAVDRVAYSRHPGKDGKPDTLRVDYYDDSGLFPVKVASEFVCVFHPLGYAKQQAEKWCKRRGFDLDSVQVNFLDFCEVEVLTPSSILLDTRGKYATIIDYKFDDDHISVYQPVSNNMPELRP